jgi:catalase-peroxidase
VPEADYNLINDREVARLKDAILDSGLSVSELVRTAWASAASYRDTDMRGGANGARIRLAPQNSWAVNQPAELERVLETLEEVQAEFNDDLRGNKQVSLADVIVLGGAAAIEKAAADAGVTLEVPFTPGRTDATQEMTDVQSFNYLEPKADGFRNYIASGYERPPVDALIERAALLDLTVPEMTVLVGGLRVLDANADGSDYGVFTDQPQVLSNDFFANLIDMSTEWKQSDSMAGVYEGYDRDSGDLKWSATPVDLIFGSNSELRAVSEYYATSEGAEVFVSDFVDAWTKVMTLDRFDLR